MKSFPVRVLLLIGLTAVPLSHSFGQYPGGSYRPPGRVNTYRPNGPFLPPPAPPARVSNRVDARGNRPAPTQNFVYVWNPQQGRWVLRPALRPQPPGAAPINPPGSSHNQGVLVGMGTNLLRPATRPFTPTSPAVSMGTNRLRPPVPVGSGGVPPLAGNPNRPAPASANLTQPKYPPPGAAPQPLFAENLGIYYEQVRYDNGTFGARLTSSPVTNAPASQLPLDAGDVILSLDGQRFRTPDDVRRPRGLTTVDYIDTARGRQSGEVTIP